MVLLTAWKRSDFYPRSSCGERPHRCHLQPGDRHFYPRSPCGERPARAASTPSTAGYFYPRSPCGERHTWQRGSRITYVISIHALLAESDSLTTYFEISSIISIHALLAESDLLEQSASYNAALISIHALRAESDCDSLRHSAQSRHFYPRSPCGERRSTTLTFPGFGMISIHALLAESDCTL